jgi:hypothetical protein
MFRQFGTEKIGLAALCTATVLNSILPTSAGAGTFDISGTACAAFNNAQADALERSHVRILNPLTSAAPIWVICPLPRDYTTANLANWAAVAFFQAPSPVTCIFREFRYDTGHVPGSGTTPGLLNASTVTISAPGVLPGVNLGTAASTTDTAGVPTSYTLTCQLAPGTGINFIRLSD